MLNYKKLFYLTVCFFNRYNRKPQTKYLGYFLSKDQIGDKDIAKQMRTLYIRPNKLLRMFRYCIINVKMELFRISL